MFDENPFDPRNNLAGDFFQELPVELNQAILSYLEPNELCKTQLVNKNWRRQADHAFLWRDHCLRLWTGKLWRNNHKLNFVLNKPQSDIKLNVREIKDLLRKANISYGDCLTHEDFLEKLKLLPKPQTTVYNYFDPDYGVKRLKSTYYHSLRYGKRTLISKSELTDMQWIMFFKHDPKTPMFPEFQENGNFIMQYGANVMRWQIQRGGAGVQIEQYPVLSVKRLSNWGWELENGYCVMRTVDIKRRINILTPQTPKYRLELANSVKEEANQLFKDGEYENALILYKTCLNYVKQVPQDLAKELLVHRNVENPLAKELVNLKVSICLNVSTCFLKMKDFNEALASAQRAIRFDPNSLKGLMRRAQAFYELKNWARCKMDLETIKKKVTGDAVVDELYKKCITQIKREEKYFESVAKAE